MVRADNFGDLGIYYCYNYYILVIPLDHYLAHDFTLGLKFMEAGALQDTFGHLLTVIILVEFNHSIVLAIRQRSGAIQVRIVVLITIIVLARKLVLLDYASASMETLGLGGLALSLGGLYWLISNGELRRRVPGSTVP
jgi:uncharacterized membrane protein (DUF373 family)